MAAHSEVLVMDIEDGSVIRANGGTVNFFVSATESYKIIIDGNLVMLSLLDKTAPNVMQYIFENISRGEHTLVVETLQGGTFVPTQELTFTVQRVSKLL